MAIKRTNIRKRNRPEALKDAPLQYAPENELGVVFLFSYLAKKWRLKIEQIRPWFPDCIAYQKARGVEKRIRIEFEFRSKNFKTQGHSVKNCDWIVCWEDNWPRAPKNLRVVELRKEFGLGFNVWIRPITPEWEEKGLSTLYRATWHVAPQTRKGDLILYYLMRPKMCIKYIYVAVDKVYYWKDKWKWYAPLRGICLLKRPIFLSDLRNHQVLKTAGFVRGNIQGCPNVTEHWPYLYDLIAKLNPSIKVKLKKFAPEKLD